jgi:hypothetical protein
MSVENRLEGDSNLQVVFMTHEHYRSVHDLACILPAHDKERSLFATWKHSLPPIIDLPLNYPALLVEVSRIELLSPACKAGMLPLSSNPQMVDRRRIELRYAACKAAILPLNYQPINAMF